ncbi:hypothetical protein D3C80_1670940 [compost metagenome]
MVTAQSVRDLPEKSSANSVSVTPLPGVEIKPIGLLVFGLKLLNDKVLEGRFAKAPAPADRENSPFTRTKLRKHFSDARCVTYSA